MARTEIVAKLNLTRRDVHALFEAHALALRHDSHPAQACGDGTSDSTVARLLQMSTRAAAQIMKARAA